MDPKLNKSYVDDTITKRKKNAANDELFANMNSHHRNIKLTVETDPTRFIDRAFNLNPNGSVKRKYFENLGKFQLFGTLKYLKGAKGIKLKVIYIEHLKLLLTLIQKFLS